MKGINHKALVVSDSWEMGPYTNSQSISWGHVLPTY